jgi:hypothetical protein
MWLTPQPPFRRRGAHQLIPLSRRKKKRPDFVKNFEKGYEQFKIGVLLKQARLEAGPYPARGCNA